jgi:PEGA domain
VAVSAREGVRLGATGKLGRQILSVEIDEGFHSLPDLAENQGRVVRANSSNRIEAEASAAATGLGVTDIVDVYNRAVLVLLRELDAMDEGDSVRSELARFADTGSDRPDFVGVPAEDGTVDAAAIAKRIGELGEPERATDQLASWLYDYASYALFLARPHLQLRGEAPGLRIAEMLQPLAPAGPVTLPPSEVGPRVTLPVPAASGVTAASGPTRIESTVRMRRVIPPEILALSAERARAQEPLQTVRMAPYAIPEPPASNPTMPSQPLAPELRPHAHHASEHVEVITVSADDAKKPASVAVPSPARSRQDALAYERAPAPAHRHLFDRSRLLSLAVIVALFGAAAAGWLAHRAAVGGAPLSEGGPRVVPSSALGASTGPAVASAATELVVVCEPRCATVYIDGKPVASPEGAIAVKPGPHDIAVRRPGYASDYRRVVVGEGESQAVTFVLAPAAQSPR